MAPKIMAKFSKMQIVELVMNYIEQLHYIHEIAYTLPVFWSLPKV